MWKPVIDKMKSQSESERLEQAENDIQLLKEIVAWLQERIEKLEKANDK
ncbi:hypothetical protein [Jeotgalibaca porci]